MEQKCWLVENLYQEKNQVLYLGCMGGVVVWSGGGGGKGDLDRITLHLG